MVIEKRGIEFLFAFLLVAVLSLGSVSALSTSFYGDYQDDGSLDGNYTITLEEGELLPASSNLVFNTSQDEYSYVLSDFVSGSTSQGNFYLKGSDVSGNGEGYGLEGRSSSTPEIEFEMEILSPQENQTSSNETSSDGQTGSANETGSGNESFSNNETSSGSDRSSEESNNDTSLNETSGNESSSDSGEESSNETISTNSTTSEFSNETSDGSGEENQTSSDSQDSSSSQASDSTNSSEDSSTDESSDSEDSSDSGSSGDSSESDSSSDSQETSSSDSESSSSDSQDSSGSDDSSSSESSSNGKGNSNAASNSNARGNSKGKSKGKGSASVTGGAISGILEGVFGFFQSLIAPTGAVSMQTEETVSGIVSVNDSYEHSDLESDEDVEIVEGSVKTSSENLTADDLSVSVENGTATVTTDYSSSSNGFGSSYEGSGSKDFVVEFSDLNNLTFPNQTGEEINVKLSYNGTEISSVSSELGNNTFALDTGVSLNSSEKKDLRNKYGNFSVETSNVEVIGQRIFVKLKLGNKWIESSYDESLSGKELKKQIEEDRVRWLGDIASSISSSSSSEVSNSTQEKVNSLRGKSYSL